MMCETRHIVRKVGYACRNFSHVMYEVLSAKPKGSIWLFKK